MPPCPATKYTLSASTAAAAPALKHDYQNYVDMMLLPPSCNDIAHVFSGM